MNDQGVQQLLEDVERKLPGLTEPTGLTAQSIGAEVKTCLEHLRSCLDYIAWDIVRELNLPISEKCKVYFPIYDIEDKYEKRLKATFPCLEVKSKAISHQMRSTQPFASSESVLGKLRDLSVESKHRGLPRPFERKFAKVVVPGAFDVEGANIVFSGNRINGMPVDDVVIVDGTVVSHGKGAIPAIVFRNHRLFLEHINEDAVDFLGKCVGQIRTVALNIYSELKVITDVTPGESGSRT